MTDQIKVRMDRGSVHATVHGERGPDDPDAGVAYMQDGLPFDGEGFLMLDHHLFEKHKGDDCSARAKKLRAVAAQKIKRAEKQKARVPVNAAPAPTLDDDGEPIGDQGSDGDDGDDEFDPDKPVDVNIEMFLRGEQTVQWQVLTQEIAGRYKRRLANMHDVIMFLVVDTDGPRIMPPQQIAKRYQKYLD